MLLLYVELNFSVCCLTSFLQTLLLNMEEEWNVNASIASLRTVNYIRTIVDKIVMPQNPPQPIIPLSIGDPTVFGNLPPPEGLLFLLISVSLLTCCQRC